MPYRTGREAWYLSVSTEKNEKNLQLVILAGVKNPFLKKTEEASPKCGSSRLLCMLASKSPQLVIWNKAQMPQVRGVANYNALINQPP